MIDESKFYELHEDTVDAVKEILDKMSIPFNLRIKYIGSTKLKQMIKLQKMSDIITHISNIDLIIYINEDYMIKLEDKNAEILLYQELDRLEFELEKGTFKIGKFALQTTPGVLKKYGIDAVSEANQLTELFTQQKSDGAEDEFDVNITPITKVKKDVEFLN